MKFHALTSTSVETNLLKTEYKSGREIGIIRLVESCLFFRRRLKVYYIPYTEMTRAFRRVMSVPAKLCCGKGEFVIENLVIYNKETEVAQIQLPGTKAARILMEELKIKAPEAIFSRPEDKKESSKEKEA